jgi:ADP-ribose pyrophosphatase YjhB (NUDIX family)
MDYSKVILEKLMYSPKLRFSDMQIEDMTSKHFTYYLKKLLEDNIITKNEGLYFLTDKGKDLVARLDEADMNIEKQPKISTAVFPIRNIGKRNYEVLVNRRLKQPYYGMVGGFTGKVRFGENFEKTARRELLEEAGLTGNFTMTGIVRKFASKNEDQTCVQDQIFILFKVTRLKGNFKKKIRDQENFWVKYSDLKKRKDLFNSYMDFLEKAVHSRRLKDFEVEYVAEGY